MGYVILLAVIFVVVGLVGAAIAIYNNLVTLHFSMDKDWANIDVLLKQRHDELPNLVAICKGYMQHEQSLLEKLTAARTSFMNAPTTNQKIEAENQASQILKSVFAVVENYPDLKANQGFLKLQLRISELENNIADRRELFNDSVNLYNTKIHQFPDMLIANNLHYESRRLLEIPVDETKSVKLDV